MLNDLPLNTFAVNTLVEIKGIPVVIPALVSIRNVTIFGKNRDIIILAKNRNVTVSVKDRNITISAKDRNITV